MSTSQAVKDAFALSLVLGQGNVRERRGSICEGSGVDLRELVQKVQSWIFECIDNHPECNGKHKRKFAANARQRSLLRTSATTTTKAKSGGGEGSLAGIPLSECLQSKVKDLPTRLLDVGPADGSINPRLRIVSEMLDQDAFKPQSYLYVALSYCWGTKPFLTTTQETLGERKKGIVMIELPRTVRDAVWFTRLLGIRYLWVDSLCILQGPGGKKLEQTGKENR
jgi:hypothetical protein